MNSLQRSDWAFEPPSVANQCPSYRSTNNNVLTEENDRRRYRSNATFMWLRCVQCCIVGLLFGGVVLAVVLTLWLTSTSTRATALSTGIYYGVTTINSSSKTTSTINPIICGFSCLNQTWTSSTGILAKWAFDGSFLDAMNNYNAIAVNSPSFVSNGYVNQALKLKSNNSQYIYTSYVPLIGASFTIEVWLYPTGFPNPTDHSILGLCTYPGNDQCLHLTIRKISSVYYLYMSFFGDNCLGISSVPLNRWTHAAFVFDNVTLSMSIYLNGILDRIAISTLSLQGNPNNVTIGYIPGIVAAYGNNFFEGYIDQLTIFNRAKPACEILEEASLATYFNFDTNPLLYDSGPNFLVTTSNSVSFVSSGHSLQAISFNDSSSYLQIADLTGLGISNQPFSISLWIRPYYVSGTLVYVSSTVSGVTWCLPFIGFASNGSMVAQLFAGTIKYVLGPAVSTYPVWSHIVETWSSTNGLRLYINNVLVASDASVTTYTASSVSNYVRLANRPNNTCIIGQIGLSIPFSGHIDDFRIYSRELTTDDVCVSFVS